MGSIFSRPDTPSHPVRRAIAIQNKEETSEDLNKEETRAKKGRRALWGTKGEGAGEEVLSGQTLSRRTLGN